MAHGCPMGRQRSGLCEARAGGARNPTEVVTWDDGMGVLFFEQLGRLHKTLSSSLPYLCHKISLMVFVTRPISQNRKLRLRQVE